MMMKMGESRRRAEEKYHLYHLKKSKSEANLEDGRRDYKSVPSPNQMSLQGIRNKVMVGLGIAFVVALFFNGFPSDNDLIDWFFIFNLVIAGFFFVIGGIKDFASNSGYGSAMRHYYSGNREKEEFTYQFKFWRFGTAGEYLVAAVLHLIISLAGSKIYWVFFKPI